MISRIRQRHSATAYDQTRRRQQLVRRLTQRAVPVWAIPRCSRRSKSTNKTFRLNRGWVQRSRKLAPQVAGLFLDDRYLPLAAGRPIFVFILAHARLVGLIIRRCPRGLRRFIGATDILPLQIPIRIPLGCRVAWSVRARCLQGGCHRAVKQKAGPW
jgi:hypothetical protein